MECGIFWNLGAREGEEKMLGLKKKKKKTVNGKGPGRQGSKVVTYNEDLVL